VISIEKLKIPSSSTVRNALESIDKSGLKIALVVDSNNQFLGTLSDGDIRRGLLRGLTLNETIKDIYSKEPITGSTDLSEEDMLRLCITKGISHLPIIDEYLNVIDLYTTNETILKKQYDNHVVLMVGGLGKRLMPLTKNIPKPMLKVGDKPILESIVKRFVKNGFTNITMCLGYKANLIKDYFQDGASFGANIDYVIEEKRMGTAGALTLLKKMMNNPFFVMNGDLLTNINFEKMLNFHIEHNAKATMCVREYGIEVPYGVVGIEDDRITSIAEKPMHSFFVSSGIYILEPECINLVPENEFYDMPKLFDTLIAAKETVMPFVFQEYWLDIGRMSDFERANMEYNHIFKI